MARQDIFDEILKLRQKGAPFCVATVLRTADATSAKAGAKAAVTAEGEIIGHLGGACVQRAVRTAATEALATGAPKVIRVKPSDKVVGLADPDGVQTFKSGCPSGGTVDILIEPWRLPPRLIVFGDGPIAVALREHAALAGFRATGGEAIAEAEAGDFVVVATQGNGDGAALKAALESPAAHVSMVASRRKARVLTEKLAAAGMDRARLERLKSPAGINIGAVDPHEIAVSILAEVIAWRNAAGKGESRGEQTA
jgi:xanthine dehydrogenase accessory factor